MPGSSTSDRAGCLHWTNERVATIAGLAVTDQSSSPSVYRQYCRSGRDGQDTIEPGICTGLRRRLFIDLLGECKGRNKLETKHGRFECSGFPRVCCSYSTKRG